MQNQMQEPVDVLRQRLNGERLVDDDVISSAAVLSDRLSQLKSLSPMFEAVGFSPDIEDMLAANLTMTAN